MRYIIIYLEKGHYKTVDFDDIMAYQLHKIELERNPNVLILYCLNGYILAR
jgi:hypothetical protein